MFSLHSLQDVEFELVMKNQCLSQQQLLVSGWQQQPTISSQMSSSSFLAALLMTISLLFSLVMTVDGKLPVMLLMASLIGLLGCCSSYDQWSYSIGPWPGGVGIRVFMCCSVKLEDYSYSTFRAMSYLKDFQIRGSLLFLMGFYWFFLLALTYGVFYALSNIFDLIQLLLTFSFVWSILNMFFYLPILIMLLAYSYLDLLINISSCLVKFSILFLAFSMMTSLLSKLFFFPGMFLRESIQLLLAIFGEQSFLREFELLSSFFGETDSVNCLEPTSVGLVQNCMIWNYCGIPWLSQQFLGISYSRNSFMVKMRLNRHELLMTI